MNRNPRLLASSFAFLMAMTAAVNSAELGLTYRNGLGRSMALELDPARGAVAIRLLYNLTNAEVKAESLGTFGPAEGTPKLAVAPIPFGSAGTSDRPAFRIACSQLSPGIRLRSDGKGIVLFKGMKAAPRFAAFSSGGKTVVKPAGEIDLSGMDAPWLLAWWGTQTPAFQIMWLGEVARPIDRPMLILFQKKPTALKAETGGWTVQFAEQAGSVIVMPLYGIGFPPCVQTGTVVNKDKAELPVFAPGTLGWDKELPADVAAQARGWAERLRRVPVNATESYEATANGVKITETFEYEDIDDDWKTPLKAWAPVPPIFGLAKATGAPIQAEGVAELPFFLGAFGPLLVAEGKDRVTFAFETPHFESYIAPKQAWRDAAPAVNSPKDKVLREELSAEIDKMLNAGGFLAPFADAGASNAGWTMVWGESSENLLALCGALPFLDGERAAKLKAYLREMAKTFPPIRGAAVRGDIRREFFDVSLSAGGRRSGGGGGSPFSSLYGCWEYVDKVAGVEQGKALWPDVKAAVEDAVGPGRNNPGFLWDAGERPGVKPFEAAGAYLAYIRFARLAGAKTEEAFGKFLFARSLAVLHAMANHHQYLVEHHLQNGLNHFPKGMLTDNEQYKGYRKPVLWPTGLGYANGLYGWENPLYFWRGILPETGQYFHDHSKDAADMFFKGILFLEPGCWLSRGLRPAGASHGEYWASLPYIPYTIFLGLATAVRPPADDLVYHVGCPRARIGDLDHIRRLALALRALAQAGPAKD